MNGNKIIICTDGSSTPSSDFKYKAASTFYIFDRGEIRTKQTSTLLGHTNNYAELHAIYKATHYCLKNMKNLSTYDEVIIATDSELCVNIFNKWIVDWLINADNEVLISSSGVPVKNQELIKSTFMQLQLLKKLVKVRLIHVNSHVSKRNSEDLYLKMSIKYGITRDEFDIIYKGNDMCDKLVNETIKKVQDGFNLMFDEPYETIINDAVKQVKGIVKDTLNPLYKLL